MTDNFFECWGDILQNDVQRNDNAFDKSCLKKNGKGLSLDRNGGIGPLPKKTGPKTDRSFFRETLLDRVPGVDFLSVPLDLLERMMPGFPLERSQMDPGGVVLIADKALPVGGNHRFAQGIEDPPERSCKTVLLA